jgi:proteasome alpha subunit
VRAADLKGFQYSRDDVDARSLANSYAQMLGQIFTHEMKPMEVEILVAEVSHEQGGDQLFHILYDGTVFDERRFSVLGGDSDAMTAKLSESWSEGMDLGAVLKAAVAALAGAERTLSADDLEIAVLSRSNGRRCFKRLSDDEVAALLATS